MSVKKTHRNWCKVTYQKLPKQEQWNGILWALEDKKCLPIKNSVFRESIFKQYSQAFNHQQSCNTEPVKQALRPKEDGTEEKWDTA